MAGNSGAIMEVHFKLFGTDGVSLQSQELTKALRKCGWRIHSCASDVPDGAEGLRLSITNAFGCCMSATSCRSHTTSRGCLPSTS